MMAKFWDKLGEGLAESWNSRLLLPAAAYMGLGLLAFIGRYGLDVLIKILNSLDATEGIALAIAGLFLIVMSGWFVQRLALPVLRLFEGYWPLRLGRLSRFFAGRLARQIDQLRRRRQELAGRFDQLSPIELEEYNRLDTQLMTYPKRPQNFLPTRLGNLLSAAEEYPFLRYGLEMSVVWPRMWLVLPETARQEVNTARHALDASVRRLLWSILAAAWVFLAWWTVLVAIGMAFISYWNLLSDCGVYSDLLRSAYDLHRMELYRELNWKPPISPEDEAVYGEQLTEYLHRGNAPQGLKFDRSKG